MTLETVRIAPSVLSADFTKLGEELDSIANADYIHYDVMDGHFVPNLSFGTGILAQVKKRTQVPVDVHLMVSNPEECVEWYLDAGADMVCFHYEAQTHAHRLISLIHSRGAQAAIALNPGTPVCVLDSLIEDVDMVLIMSVNPGFGGQSYIEGTYSKLRELKKLCAAHGVSPLIEVDGGVGMKNIAAIVEAGANVLVAGSAVFNAADHAAEVDNLRTEGARGLDKRA